jgi:cell division protein FtsQ
MERLLAGGSLLSRSPNGRSTGRTGPSRVLAPLAEGGARLRALLARVWSRRAGRVAVIVAMLATMLLGAGWLWLRNSPLVAVEHVTVIGVQGPEAGAIDGALVAAAHGMTTLHVRDAALRAAVSAYPVVREVRASASFPHSLRITVVEQLPAAALVVSGTRTAVAANGVVLGPALLSSELPALGASYAPATGQRVAGASQLQALQVLGAAPVALARAVSSVYVGPRGLTAAMRNGLLVYFGDATRPHAKWFALARVLADPSSGGASYVDVRLPSRPAAGFPEGVAPSLPATAGTESAAQPAAHESTVGALAAGLEAGGAVSSKRATGEPEASSGESGSGSHEASEGSTGSGGEHAPPAGGEPESRATGGG